MHRLTSAGGGSTYSPGRGGLATAQVDGGGVIITAEGGVNAWSSKVGEKAMLSEESPRGQAITSP